MYYYSKARNAVQSPAPMLVQPSLSYFLRNCTRMTSPEIIVPISLLKTNVLMWITADLTATRCALRNANLATFSGGADR